MPYRRGWGQGTARIRRILKGAAAPTPGGGRSEGNCYQERGGWRAMAPRSWSRRHPLVGTRVTVDRKLNHPSTLSPLLPVEESGVRLAGCALTFGSTHPASFLI